MHRTAPIAKNYSVQSVKSAEVKKRCCHWYASFHWFSTCSRFSFPQRAYTYAGPSGWSSGLTETYIPEWSRPYFGMFCQILVSVQTHLVTFGYGSMEKMFKWITWVQNIILNLPPRGWVIFSWDSMVLGLSLSLCCWQVRHSAVAVARLPGVRGSIWYRAHI